MTEAVAVWEEWDRRPDESARAFAAFAAYRDLGPQRSLAKLARILHEAGTGASAESVRKGLGEWSVRHGWQARVLAWDVAEDRRLRAEREQDLREMEQRHLAGSSAMTYAALARMRGLERENGTTVAALDPNAIQDWSEAGRVFAEAVRIERLTRGLPTDVSRSLSSVPLEQAGRLVRTLVEGALAFIPEASQPAFVQWAVDVCRNVT